MEGHTVHVRTTPTQIVSGPAFLLGRTNSSLNSAHFHRKSHQAHWTKAQIIREVQGNLSHPKVFSAQTGETTTWNRLPLTSLSNDVTFRCLSAQYCTLTTRHVLPRETESSALTQLEQELVVGERVILTLV